MEGKRKKTIIGLEVFLRAYIRIFDIDDKTQDFLSLFVPFSNQCGSNFNNSRHANPPIRQPRKRSWGICFRYMAACRYILFTVPSPFPSIPPRRLIYGFPSRYSSPSCSNRVHSCAFIRTSRVLVSRYFAREGRRHDQVNPVVPFPYPTSSAIATYSYYGDWRFCEETSSVLDVSIFVQI